jgi:hypothetical protein
MPDHSSSTSTSFSRQLAPAVIVTCFALVMSACVLGVVVWKAVDAKATTLERGQTATENLAHSLAEHASHAVQAVDIAMSGIVEFLKYQTPNPERFNRFLSSAADALPRRSAKSVSLAPTAPGNTPRSPSYRATIIPTAITSSITAIRSARRSGSTRR